MGYGTSFKDEGFEGCELLSEWGKVAANILWTCINPDPVVLEASKQALLFTHKALIY